MENKSLVKDKSSKIKYILSLLFLVLLIIVTFVVIFTKYDINDLLSIIKKINYNYIVIGVFLVLLYILFESLATKTILNTLGVKSGLFSNIEYSSIDYYFCSITPSATGGQPMVLYYMNKDNISVAKGSITLLLNTALFKIVLLVLSIFAIIISRNIIFDSFLMIILVILGFVINIFLVLICFLASFKTDWILKIGKRLIFWLNRIKLVKKPIKMCKIFIIKMEEYKEAALIMKQNVGKFLLSLLFNFIQRISLFSIAYLVYLAFRDIYPEIIYFNYFELLSIQVIIALSVDSLPLPGGMGISEYLYVHVYESIYITENIIASAMLLTRAISFYFPLIFTAFIIIEKHIRNIIKGKKSIGEFL